MIEVLGEAERKVKGLVAERRAVLCAAACASHGSLICGGGRGVTSFRDGTASLRASAAVSLTGASFRSVFAAKCDNFSLGEPVCMPEIWETCC